MNCTPITRTWGIHLCSLSRLFETDKNDPTKAAPFSVSAVDYGNFLIRMFDLWQADFVDGVPTTSIRPFRIGISFVCWDGSARMHLDERNVARMWWLSTTGMFIAATFLSNPNGSWGISCMSGSSIC